MNLEDATAASSMTQLAAETNIAAAQRSREAMAEIASDYPGISVTVFQEGQKVWSFHSGFADLAGRGPANDATRYTIYSTSKILTGLAFARLVEKGAVSLDMRVDEIAPDLPSQFHSIRLRDLLSHTSGLRHYASPEDWLNFAHMRCHSPEDAIMYFANDPLLHEPGENETYSTFAFVLASELLVRITKRDSFVDALNHALGDWASYELDSADAQKATSYVKASRIGAAGPGIAQDDFVVSPIASNECKFGGGGLIASSADLAKAGLALASGEIFPGRLIAQRLQAWSEASGVVYGGGVSTQEIAGENSLVFASSGAAPGGRSTLLVLIEPQLSIAIAGNAEGPRFEDTAMRIAEAWATKEKN